MFIPVCETHLHWHICRLFPEFILRVRDNICYYAALKIRLTVINKNHYHIWPNDLSLVFGSHSTQLFIELYEIMFSTLHAVEQTT